ncbi:MAG TPA: response regulator [Steroidobacteraceae bacterium]|jgi:PAS domain S-box-containing protein|nr:response regulator [Steroidobacteraceae bacterium]
MATDESIDRKHLLDAINGGLIVLDHGRRVVGWNAWMETASGRSEQDTRGRLLAEIFAGADLTRLVFAIQAALTSRSATILTHAINPALLPLQTRSKQPLLHDITVSPVGIPPIRQCLVFVNDVTRATRRERYLRDRQTARYDAVVANAPDLIITVDQDGLIQFANPAALSELGYASEALMGIAAQELFQTKDQWQSVLQCALRNSPAGRPIDLIARRRDGTPSHLEASTSLWASGANNFVTVILRDVNERRATNEALRKSETEARDAAAALSELNQTLEQRVQERTAQLMQMEEELRQSQKMEAIGQLTGGIAHDFNNLLQGITGGLDLVKKRVMQGRFNEIDRFISGAMTSANRASALTHRLLAFSRRQPLAPKPLEVNPLLASMEELLRRTLGERVIFELVTAGGLWLTKCDPNQLENAILNLVINARDAMPDGGRLTVETGNSHLDNAYTTIHPEIEPGQYVCISVTDTGSGMSAATIEKAFEPFFTTKPIGRGTGLGLSMIYGFAKQSGGHAKIYSELDKGTSVRLYLPRFMGQIEQEGEIADLSDIYNAHTNETVLVVEDEFVVRELIVEVLKELGYSTLEADDGPAALKIMDSKQRIDLVISDIGLPGLNGRQIIDAARETRPSLKVLFMTGYAENAAIAAGFLEPGMSMITKPFAMEALATRIREMLEK